ncbi:MAG TPA: hypothetical protein VLG71_00510, partial [Candidatus Limnocylindria bacterium]|nr:hypothetical protein [Candidatus Limnocylindria bacterium]
MLLISKKIAILSVMLTSSLNIINASAPEHHWLVLSNTKSIKPALQEELAKTDLACLPRELIRLVAQYAHTHEPIAQYLHGLDSPTLLVKTPHDTLIAAALDYTAGVKHPILRVHPLLNDQQEIAPEELVKPSASKRDYDNFDGHITISSNGLLIYTVKKCMSDLAAPPPTFSNHFMFQTYLAFDSAYRAFKQFISEPAKHVKTLYQGHSKRIQCVIALPNNTFLSGSDDKTIKEWQAGNPQAINTYYGHNDGVTCLAPLSNGRFISGSRNGTIKEWTPRSSKALTTYETKANQEQTTITCLTELKNSNFIASSAAGIIEEWSLKTKELAAIYKAHI